MKEVKPMALALKDEKFTYGDYQRLSDKPRIELIDGEFYVSPAPRTYHQEIVGWLFIAMTNHADKHHLGKVYIAPTDVCFGKYNVVQPDIVFIAKKHLSIITSKNVKGSPDLVVEALSPGSTSRDQVLKKGIYEKFGVKEYWVVDPEARSIKVLTLKGKKYQEQVAGRIVRSTVLKNFEVDAGSLFRKKMD